MTTNMTTNAVEVKGASARPHLLIVEDDPDQYALIERAARGACPEVVIHRASDAEAALAILERQPLALVFADYLLADSENGWWILDACRRLQPDARIALDSSLPLRLPDGTRCSFLRKPFSARQCREFIASQLT